MHSSSLFPICVSVLDFFESKEYEILQERAKQNLKLSGGRGKKTPVGEYSVSAFHVDNEISNKFNISKDTIRKVMRIKNSGNQDLIDKFRRGEITLSQAYHYILHGHFPCHCVYFIRESKTGLIKIGKTYNAKVRFKRLRTMNAGDLECLCMISGYTKEEVELKARFKKYCDHGEWHKPAQEILDYIEELKKDNKDLYFQGDK